MNLRNYLFRKIEYIEAKKKDLLKKEKHSFKENTRFILNIDLFNIF